MQTPSPWRCLVVSEPLIVIFKREIEMGYGYMNKTNRTGIETLPTWHSLTVQCLHNKSL